MKRKALALCLIIVLVAPIMLLIRSNSVSATDPYDWLLDLGDPYTVPPSNVSLALPLIRIRSDGSVEGTNLLRREGNTYTFTGDIGSVNWTDYNAFKENSMWSRGIVVERDNIVINGAGYALTGCGHFELYYFGPPGQVAWVPIYNPEKYRGIDIAGKDNVLIKNLTIQLFSVDISVTNSSELKIQACNLTSANIDHSPGAILTDNNLGTIQFSQSHDCVFYNNTIRNVNTGLSLYHSNDNIIVMNTFQHTSMAIFMDSAIGNIILNNNITDNYVTGIDMGSSNDTIVSGNIFSNGESAIFLFDLNVPPSNNVFCKNQIVNNSLGIELLRTYNNTFYANNFIDNKKQVGSKIPIGNFWDNGSVGNYWSNYNGSDLNLDGKGDTAYILNEKITAYSVQDNYPLMAPVEIYSQNAELPEWARERLNTLGIMLPVLLSEATQQTQSKSFPTLQVATVSTALAIVIAAGFTVYFKKRKHQGE